MNELVEKTLADHKAHIEEFGGKWPYDEFSESELSVLGVLLMYESYLTDGYLYYCGPEDFTRIVKQIAKMLDLDR